MLRMAFCVFACWNLWHIQAAAQSYPVKTIRIVVGYAPGGGVDVSARTIARRLTETFGQAVVVENRTGASGNTAAGMVAKSAPDGYTLYMASSTIALPGLFLNLPYDVRKDLSPISLVALGPSVLVVHPSVPVRDVKELVQFGRGRPGQLMYGSAGYGTVTHLAMELLQTVSGVKMVHIPYRGGAPSVIGLLSGEAHLLFAAIPGVLSQVNAGRVRALAVSTLKRSSALPAVPTIHEAAVPGYDTSSWYGLLGPANTPKHVSDLLSTEIAKIMQSPDIRDGFIRTGFEPEGTTPEAFAAFIRSEIAKYQAVIEKANIKPEAD
jgi:tripartite-type tricarboxylate transporter receptor subunit TctC